MFSTGMLESLISSKSIGSVCFYWQALERNAHDKWPSSPWTTILWLASPPGLPFLWLAPDGGSWNSDKNMYTSQTSNLPLM